MDSTTAPATSTRRETINVIVLLAAILLLNLVTAMTFPAVWQDEVMYTDPAANVVLGRGFTSSAWYVQSSNQYWAANAPLHELVLARWLKVFGLSPLAVRTINYVWFVLGTFLAWQFCVRTAVINRPRLRLLCVILLACGSGISFSYRSGRPDMICYFLAAATLCASTIRSFPMRYSVLMALGFLYPWAGLPLLPFLVLATGLALVFFGWKSALNGVCTGIGAALGLAGLYLFFRSHGVWDSFAASVQLHASGKIAGVYGHAQWNVIPALLIRDRSAPLLLLAAVVLMGWNWKHRDAAAIKTTAFAIATGLGIPLAMHFTGVFPIYYGWMAALPVTLALCHALSIQRTMTCGPKTAVSVLLIAAMIIGLPIRLITAAIVSSGTSYAESTRFVTDHLKSSDVAYVDYAAFYPATASAGKIYTLRYMEYAMTPEEKQSVNVLVISPSHFSTATNYLPGNWISEATFDGGIATNRLPNFIAKKLEEGTTRAVHDPYHFTIYRKSM